MGCEECKLFSWTMPSFSNGSNEPTNSDTTMLCLANHTCTKNGGWEFIAQNFSYVFLIQDDIGIDFD